MRAFWTLLFLFVPVLGVGLFAYSYVRPGAWLPPNVSPYGTDIDFLFYVILWITGIIFVVTELLLVWAMYTGRGQNGGKATYSHGNRALEIGWTLMTALILLFIAFYQVPTWAQNKYFSTFKAEHPNVKPHALVIASQFQWEVRQPTWDAEANKLRDLNYRSPSFHDSLETYNEMHIPKGEEILIYLTTRDVIHSFWVPAMRVKQDALPGNVIPVWFRSDKAGEYEWVCAELCGWGHYRMRAKVVVHESRSDYEEWVKQKTAEQIQAKPELAVKKQN